MNPLRWFINRFRPETNDSAGIGPIRLGPEYHWMDRAWRLHDHDYRESDYRETPDIPVPAKRRSESDWDAFYRLVLLAKAESDPIVRCRMVLQICEVWPWARQGGLYFWGPTDDKG